MSNIFAIIGLILMIARMLTIRKPDFDINKAMDTIVTYDLLIILFELITTILIHSWMFLVITIICIVIFILDTL